MQEYFDELTTFATSRLKGDEILTAGFSAEDSDFVRFNHAAVRHEDFVYVPDEADDRIAVRFAVVNTHHDGGLAQKSNCNFFELRDGRFSTVRVYMAGENTLEAK